MTLLKGAEFGDRAKTSADAKAALLDRFRARPPADDPDRMARDAERGRVIEARDSRVAERLRIKREEEEVRLAAEEAEKARLAAEAELAKAALLEEQKAARDRRYALRKARR
ncbi:DUF6481 family protein [Roseomonas sp. CCTCC AB2023176]|uniref:DUF6481 family protein n=1 Tax=Roseomonas sp. CCTCC AB2023176 TaxID=3342640 RepID=UPI0035DF81FB